MTEWRFTSLCREALLNLVRGGTRFAITSFVLATMFAAAGWVEATTVESIIDRETALEARGRYVLQLSSAASNPTPLDAAACENLTAQGGVTDAGSVMSTEFTAIGSSPSSRVRQILMSPGAFRVLGLGAGVGGSEVVVGAELANELGIGASSTVATSIGLFDVGSKAQPVVRYPEANRAVVVPATPNGIAIQCLVDVEPVVFDEYAGGGVGALADLTTGEVVVVPLVQVEPGRSPSDEYSLRLTRHAGTALGLLLVLLVSVAMQARRAEINLYRAIGSTRRAAFVIHYLELLATLVFAGAVGLAVFGAGARSADLQPQSIRHGLLVLASGGALAIAGGLVPLVLILLRRNVIDALKGG